MKKTIPLVLALIIALGCFNLIACSGVDSGTPPSSNGGGSTKEANQPSGGKTPPAEEKKPATGGALSDILARGTDIDCYHFDMVITHPGGSPVTTTTWIKGNKSRAETTVPGMGKMIMIMDKDTGIFYTIKGDIAMKMALSDEEIESPMNKVEAILDYNPTVVGSETIDGKKCTIVEYTVEGNKTKMWIWNDHGMPVKWETTLPQGVLRIEQKNMGFDCPPDSMFELPPGVQVMEN